MKILFIQLPVQDPAWESARANVPLAAGYLAAFAEKKGLIKRADWSILPREVSDKASDSAVAQHVAASGADLVCFSLYLWNLERSMHIAQVHSALLPQARLVAGGPEVVPGMPIFGRSPFHALVEGRGASWAFCELLEDMRRGRPLARRYAATKQLDLADLPNPLSRRHPPLRSRPARPSRDPARLPRPAAAYCYYGKNYGNVRPFPREDAYKVIEEAGRAGARELYLMDPSFQATEDLQERLVSLARANTGGLAIHAELRLESVTEESGRLYQVAGLVSAEVGLQSTNPKALEAVHRSWDRKAFERGAEILKKNNVVVKTGLILGLPFRRLRRDHCTLDFLGMQGLGQEAELYPLALLPGTESASGRGNGACRASRSHPTGSRARTGSPRTISWPR